MTKLSINLNAIALLRNRRDLSWPDMIDLARVGLNAGAKGITVHPRPDQRHIRFSDIKLISNFLKSEFPTAIFNLEGYPSEEFLNLALPYADQITLVPDSPEQKTSDHGWILSKEKKFINTIVEKIKNKRKILVSAFINSGETDFKNLKVDSVEMYTGPYALCYNEVASRNCELQSLLETAKQAKAYKIAVNAGHDLTIENISELKKVIPWIKEASIGHGLISDVLYYGMEKSVKRFIKLLGV